MSVTHVVGTFALTKLRHARKVSSTIEIKRRNPQQDRALQKIGLIFEATILLLERVEIADLSTNAIAAKAGISIGTLYQYFGDKDAILDALTDREFKGMSGQIADAMDLTKPRAFNERFRLLVSAVFEAYGGRDKVHRALLERSLTRSRGARLNALLAGLSQQLTRDSRSGRHLTTAEAFVLTHAVAGVLRAVTANAYPMAQRQTLEEALMRLTSGFIGAAPVKGAR